ncbi:FecR family protein [Advenella mimigardefordensis]|uniref:Transmembrane sensor FecR n=1 Tax=Advenella mimigardefordensis (strain DSM 17166 / LMG 22922 / DPN7) TaxID=1247726 RepID=W0PAV2_ADVMD|nr:FecR family protein [Advenella mimigardefordensis]AHG62545.1 transmembrane sensor FecR [Advenella mimigardefordensis DPN7]
MTEPGDQTPSDVPFDQALHWFTKARLGTLSSQEKHEFEIWRAANVEHERQYRSLERFWETTDLLPRNEMRAIMDQSEVQTPMFSQRRRLMLGAGALCTAALAVGALGRNTWWSTPDFTTQFSTTKGERKRFYLPDDSVLDLNTATRVAVTFYDDRRVVQLVAGEALFSVSPDTARPFTVDAGRAQVLVTGTRFNVRRDDETVAVAVDEGAVEFSAGPWWKRNRTRLTAGYVSRASADGTLTTPYQDNVASLLSWQRGRLVFENTPLSQVVAELNRYLAFPLSTSNTHLGRIRISGTVGIDSPESLLTVLPQIAPVKVRRLADGRAVLESSR